MADYIRRLVSFDRARFKDDTLQLELDLVYITNRVIIMGYPASGIEGLYRNRREDAIKFLEHRHGQNFWVFNFCPLRENSYPASVFNGRVSRYPFPDHHVPPLLYLPLAVREMQAWLDGSEERVVVLHCKAGKGRSGTLACSLLLSLDEIPLPPRSSGKYSAKERAKSRVEDVVASLPAELDDAPLKGESEVDACVYENGVTTKTDAPVSPPDTEIFPGNPSLTTNAMPKSVKDVLDLHTSRRMRPPSPSKGQNHGVSIQSQRRWLYYWSLLLAHEAPSQIWPLCPTPGKSRAQVSLRHLKLQMREPSGVSMGFVEVVSKVIESANLGKEGPKGQGRGRFWASVARYDDQLMHVLEKWERQTRHDSGNLGKRRNYSDCAGNDRPSTIFEPGKWDTEKMVKTVARLGAVSGSLIELGNGEKNQIRAHTLRPLSKESWETALEDGVNETSATPAADFLCRSMQGMQEKEGIILDATREVRVKLYHGQVLMGWFWFIPTFHMPQASRSPTLSKLILQRSDIDFPLGIGARIVNVEVGLEWCSAKPEARLDAGSGSQDNGEQVAAELQAPGAVSVHQVIEE